MKDLYSRLKTFCLICGEQVDPNQEYHWQVCSKEACVKEYRVVHEMVREHEMSSSSESEDSDWGA